MHRPTAVVSLDTPFATEEVGWNDEVIQKGGIDPADLLLRRENDAIIQQVLSSLPSTYRTAVELCDIEGLSCERISEIMVCPLETVRLRLQQGHMLMKRALKDIERGTKKLH